MAWFTVMLARQPPQTRHFHISRELPHHVGGGTPRHGGGVPEDSTVPKHPGMTSGDTTKETDDEQKSPLLPLFFDFPPLASFKRSYKW